MRKNQRVGESLRGSALAALLVASPAMAGSDIDALRQQVEALQRQLVEIHEKLAKQEVLEDKVEKVAKAQSQWTESSSVVHLAGYGSAGYTDNEATSGRFSQVQFSPIIHYMYKDLFMLESELELTLQPDGETETALEYMTIDWFASDYAILQAGKFLSPLGQFRQNLHPSWINKLPSAPPGFGHDGAAPISEVGLQVRGGLPLGGMRSNYALYVGNGPELNAVEEDGEVELEGIEAEGRTRDADGKKVWGGRFGILPLSGLELGFSFATGKAAVTNIVDEDAGTSTSVSGDVARDYDVLGTDFSWKLRGIDLRGEYVRSKLGDAAGSVAESGAEWRSWYTQASYQIPSTKLEGVVRYTDFDSPHGSEDQRQWALGANYLFAPNAIFKLGYEFNDGQEGAESNEDSVLAQLAYGF